MKKIVIFLGGSGTGKSYTENKILESYPKLFDKVISSTTRKARQGEIDGVDYYFKNSEKHFFEEDYAEHDFFKDNYYGTPKNELFKNNKNIVLTMEPNGAKKIIKYIEQNQIEIKPIIVYFKLNENDRLENMQTRGDDHSQIAKRINDDIDQRFTDNQLKADILITSKEKDNHHMIVEKVLSEF